MFGVGGGEGGEGKINIIMTSRHEQKFFFFFKKNKRLEKRED